jgi:hypothetical protein
MNFVKATDPIFLFVQNSKSKLPVIGGASFRSEKDQSSPSDLGEEGTDSEDDINSDQGPTLSMHDKSSRQSGTCSISSDAKGTSQDVLENHEKYDRDEIPGNLETEASEGRRNTLATKLVGKEYSIQSSHSFSQKGEDGLRKVSFVSLRHCFPSTFLDDSSVC